MSEEARRFRLGLFVIGGLVLLAVGVFALTAGRLFRRTHELYCYFQENVQGLEQGGTVKFRGVEVGHVESVNVIPRARIAAGGQELPRNSYTIEVRSKLFIDKISDDTGGVVDPAKIDEAIASQVKKGLRVRIAWKDITGQKYLELDYVDPAKSPPPPLPFEPSGTYVPTSVEKSITDIQRDVATVTSELAQVDYKAVVQDVRTLMATLQKTIGEIDVKKFGEAADAVRDLARDPRIDAVLVRVDGTLAKLESAASHLDEFLARPAMAAGVDDAATAAAALKRVAAQLEEALPKLTASVEETLAAARRALDESRLSETTAAARSAVADVGNTARQMGALRESARKTLADLDEASRGLAQLVKYVEENPNALLHGKMEDPK
jgi:ABC-type transporter Mla subunit MlaD